MSTLYRAQVVLKHRSGIPRDSAVNNFWLWDLDAAAPSAEGLAEGVRDFYVNPNAGGWAIMDLFGYQVASTGHEVRMYKYDMITGDRLPFLNADPEHVEVFDLVGRAARPQDDQLPSEVALCLSYANVGSSDTPARRRRGRIYLGPLCETAISRTVDGRVVPQASVVTSMLEAGDALADRMRVLLGADSGWVVYSRPYEGRAEIVRPGRTTLPAIPARQGSVHLINEVSVDNAMDTQRKRGERATTRTRQTA